MCVCIIRWWPLIKRNMIQLILILFQILPYKISNDIYSTLRFTRNNDTLSLDEQLIVLDSLGYVLNEGITKRTILNDIAGNYVPETNLEQEFRNQPFGLLYFTIGGFSLEQKKYYTNKCIVYNLGFNDLGSDFVSFIQRMGVITNGELKYSDIELKIENGYQWLKFKVNGTSKSWKLMAIGQSDDSFFNRFLELTTEFKTKGKYTYFDIGGSDFILDYATEEEQKRFISKTELKREWLGEGNHFSKYVHSK